MLEMLQQQLARDSSLTVTLRVRPGASVTKIKGTLADGTLKLDIAAAPEDGKANDELMRFLATAFNVTRRQIELLAGHTSRTKVVRITA